MDQPPDLFNITSFNKVLSDPSCHRQRDFLHNNHVRCPDVQAARTFSSPSPARHERLQICDGEKGQAIRATISQFNPNIDVVVFRRLSETDGAWTEKSRGAIAGP